MSAEFFIMKRIIFFTLCSAAAVTRSAHAADVDISKLPPAATKTDVTYATDIKPIFEKSCFKCHGSEKQKGKLRVDSLEAVLKGGEDGKVVEPGKSAKSPLVIAVARLNEEEAMPPTDKGQPLTKEQAGLVRAWVDQGCRTSDNWQGRKAQRGQGY